MARLCLGEKEQITNDILRLIRRYDNGLSEQEIAHLAAMERRRLNNYLNELEGEDKIYREGRFWFAS